MEIYREGMKKSRRKLRQCLILVEVFADTGSVDLVLSVNEARQPVASIVVVRQDHAEDLIFDPL